MKTRAAVSSPDHECFLLVRGFALAYVVDAYFDCFYTSATGLGLAIMLVALVANPDLIGDLSEAARVKYSASTLRDVDS